MSNRPLVSVIIIFLDAAKFIQEAIESICSQTYAGWELLLVDDGSTDASTEIALRYAEKCPGKIRYLEHEGHKNHGMSATRNLGLRHATGEYIAFLDADDVWLRHKLKQQLKIMQLHPEAGMVYGASQYWYSWVGELENGQRDHTPRLGVRPDTLMLPPTLLMLSLQSVARTPCPSDFLIRRDVVKEVGGFEEHFSGIYQLYEDQAFLAKVFLKAPVFVAGECWDKYRQHPDSCVSVVTGRGQKYAAGLFYLRWLERYLSERAVNDYDLWKALRSKRFRYRYPNFNRLLNSAHRRLLQTKELIGQIGGRAVR